MTAPDPLAAVTAARLPASTLAALAPVRDRADVRAHPDGDIVWVTWPAGAAAVARCLHPVEGVAFYVLRDGQWFRFGSRLPAADGPPPGDGRPLAGLLTPARFDPVPPADAGPPVRLGVAPGGGPKPVTALVCEVTALAHWADATTTAELAAVRAARDGSRAVLLGMSLPAIPGAARYWGDDVLVPVGHRPDPDLPPAAVRAAAGAAAGELVLLDAGGAEVIPRVAFAPLTRAGVRLATRVRS
jgi:hypothetical protein